MSDLISRADAICEVLVNDGINNIVDRINALPSAEAVEVVRCKDCRQKHIGGSVTHYYWCDLWGREVDGDNYCSWAEERKGGDDE